VVDQLKYVAEALRFLTSYTVSLLAEQQEKFDGKRRFFQIIREGRQRSYVHACFFEVTIILKVILVIIEHT